MIYPGCHVIRFRGISVPLSGIKNPLVTQGRHDSAEKKENAKTIWSDQERMIEKASLKSNFSKPATD